MIPKRVDQAIFVLTYLGCKKIVLRKSDDKRYTSQYCVEAVTPDGLHVVTKWADSYLDAIRMVYRAIRLYTDD